MTIIFCLPGNSFSNNFLDSWSRLLCTLIQRGHTPLLSMAQDSVVYYVRNKCLRGDVLRGKNQKPFNGELKYDYMMWIDSDIVFNPEHFLKLLSWDKDIVSGLYMMQGGQNFATVQNWDEEFFKKYGTFQFMTQEDIKNKTDLMEVDYTGFGFLLAKYGVFESLEYPWFRPLWFNIGPAQDFCSEDVSACRLLKENKYKIYIDPTVRVGHEKKVIY